MVNGYSRKWDNEGLVTIRAQRRLTVRIIPCYGNIQFRRLDGSPARPSTWTWRSRRSDDQPSVLAALMCRRDAVARTYKRIGRSHSCR